MEWTDAEWYIPHDPAYTLDDERREDDRSSNKPVDPDDWSNDDITGG